MDSLKNTNINIISKFKPKSIIYDYYKKKRYIRQLEGKFIAPGKSTPLKKI